MSSTYGQNIKLTIFGESHSDSIGVTMEGLPAGFPLNRDKLNAFLTRRAPGTHAWSTPRKEADEPEFLCGIVDDVLCGSPLTAVIRNTNIRSKDYQELVIKPRPGHADYTAKIKYKGANDYRGGGHFSGRLTAPLCIAGGICLQILEKEGITVRARICSIGEVEDTSPFTGPVDTKEFPAVSDTAAKKMEERIGQVRAGGDSIGGVVECVAEGVPVGLGDPMFDGMENRIASIIFGIPAVKGLEFGSGFDSCRMCGSENNDAFETDGEKVITQTNHCGGILGGISNGMPITFRVGFKPTPSIAKEQQTVNLETMENTTLKVEGRHDPCIVPRAVPVVEAAAAIAIYDALLEYRKYGE